MSFVKLHVQSFLSLFVRLLSVQFVVLHSWLHPTFFFMCSSCFFLVFMVLVSLLKLDFCWAVFWPPLLLFSLLKLDFLSSKFWPLKLGFLSAGFWSSLIIVSFLMISLFFTPSWFSCSSLFSSVSAELVPFSLFSMLYLLDSDPPFFSSEFSVSILSESSMMMVAIFTDSVIT